MQPKHTSILNFFIYQYCKILRLLGYIVVYTNLAINENMVDDQGETIVVREWDERGMRAELLDPTFLNLAPLCLPIDTPACVYAFDKHKTPMMDEGHGLFCPLIKLSRGLTNKLQNSCRNSCRWGPDRACVGSSRATDRWRNQPLMFLWTVAMRQMLVASYVNSQKGCCPMLAKHAYGRQSVRIVVHK
jgi:hypothetical protein